MRKLTTLIALVAALATPAAAAADTLTPFGKKLASGELSVPKGKPSSADMAASPPKYVGPDDRAVKVPSSSKPRAAQTGTTAWAWIRRNGTAIERATQVNSGLTPYGSAVVAFGDFSFTSSFNRTYSNVYLQVWWGSYWATVNMVQQWVSPGGRVAAAGPAGQCCNGTVWWRSYVYADNYTHEGYHVDRWSGNCGSPHSKRVLCEGWVQKLL